MKTVYLITGSNLGNRFNNLLTGKLQIGKFYSIDAYSSIYKSEPWGYVDNTDYLNQVIVIKTNDSAGKVLETILSIEKVMGRTRRGKGYTARTIDIDILFYEHEIINQENLKIPHPRLHERKFALLPLVEIVPTMIHPVFGKTVSELLDICEDTSTIKKI